MQMRWMRRIRKMKWTGVEGLVIGVQSAIEEVNMLVIGVVSITWTITAVVVCRRKIK